MGALGVQEKCKLLVLERLKMNAEIKGQWQDVSSFTSLLLLYIFGLDLFVSP